MGEPPESCDQSSTLFEGRRFETVGGSQRIRKEMGRDKCQILQRYAIGEPY
eukprot:CCRYP_005580-RD/>CCRYP_005580-RD protein AED:0.48 eAED:0.48 QI:0/-1/0/1/-1/0/1/0/50